MMKRRTIEASSFCEEKLATPFNFRSPVAVVDALKDIIKDKTVCDLGCGEGDILFLMQKYAKSVIGFERSSERYIHAQKRGIPLVIGDFTRDPIPDADMYYMWPDNYDFLPSLIKMVKEKPFSTTFLLAGGLSLEGNPAKHILTISELYDLETIEFYYKETHHRPEVKNEGMFSIGIIQFPLKVQPATDVHTDTVKLV